MFYRNIPVYTFLVLTLCLQGFVFLILISFQKLQLIYSPYYNLGISQCKAVLTIAIKPANLG